VAVRRPFLCDQRPWFNRRAAYRTCLRQECLRWWSALGAPAPEAPPRTHRKAALARRCPQLHAAPVGHRARPRIHVPTHALDRRGDGAAAVGAAIDRALWTDRSRRPCRGPTRRSKLTHGRAASARERWPHSKNARSRRR